MSKAKTQATSSKAFVTDGGYSNFLAGVGIGTANQATAARYTPNFVSHQRYDLESMYRSSWIAGKAVDVFADDMTRKGIDIQNLNNPEQLTLLHSSWKDLRIWDQVANVIRWARLYGGCVGVYMVNGATLSTPLAPERIGTGDFRGIQVFDRWQVTPSTGTEMVTELGPDLGMPLYYTVNDDSMALSSQKIHYTRLFRIQGQDLPYWQTKTEQGWGQSVLERLYDRLLAFDSTTEGTAQLVFKAHLRIIKIKGLRTIIAQGGQLMKGLLGNINMIRAFQTNEGITLLDLDDEFEAQTYSFGGLDLVLLQLMQQISGALQIPLVRLLGQSPGGLNSTGESDLVTYYDGIHTEQERRLRTPMKRLLDISFYSLFGTAPPVDLDFHFTSLWQMSDIDKARITVDTVTALTTAYSSQNISQQVVGRELQHLSRKTDTFTTLTDEDVKAMDDAIPPNDEISLQNQANMESSQEQDPDGDTPDDDADEEGGWRDALSFEELKHPRVKHGKGGGEFAKGNHSGASSTKQPVKKKPSSASDPSDKPGAGGKQAGGTATLQAAPDKDKWPEHIKALKLPPAWKDVKINPDPKANLQAIGKDAKGRAQYVYSEKFKESQAALKFTRIKELDKKFTAVEAENANDLDTDDPVKKQNAEAARLVMTMGVRPGNDTDTAAKVKAYGATTLEGRHVVVEQDGIYLRFVGKKGVPLNLAIPDKHLAQMMVKKSISAGPSGRLFPDVTDKSLLKYSHSLDGGKFKTKDFRTLLGTREAMNQMKTLPAPTNIKEYKAQTMAVAAIVAKKLGNTPVIALQSYISPVVFAPWKSALKQSAASEKGQRAAA